MATTVLTQNKGPGTEAHFWNPPRSFAGRPCRPPPPAKQFSGRLISVTRGASRIVEVYHILWRHQHTCQQSDPSGHPQKSCQRIWRHRAVTARPAASTQPGTMGWMGARCGLGCRQQYPACILCWTRSCPMSSEYPSAGATHCDRLPQHPSLPSKKRTLSVILYPGPHEMHAPFACSP